MIVTTTVLLWVLVTNVANTSSSRVALTYSPPMELQIQCEQLKKKVLFGSSYDLEARCIQIPIAVSYEQSYERPEFRRR